MLKTISKHFIATPTLYRHARSKLHLGPGNRQLLVQPIYEHSRLLFEYARQVLNRHLCTNKGYCPATNLRSTSLRNTILLGPSCNTYLLFNAIPICLLDKVLIRSIVLSDILLGISSSLSSKIPRAIITQSISSNVPPVIASRISSKTVPAVIPLSISSSIDH